MKRLITNILFLLTAALAMGQNSLNVQAPEIVALDERFNVTFVISGRAEPSSFDWVPGDGFQLVWGPQKGSYHQRTIINGKSESSTQTTYTYVLMPKSAGKFIIPAAKAKVKGETLTSEPFSIEVVASSAGKSGLSGHQGSSGSANSSGMSGASGSGNASGSGSSSGSRAAATGDIDNSDLFMRLNVSKSSVVVGESLTATLKLYQRVNISGFEDARFPSFNGFWSQQIQAPTNIEFRRENVDGQIYNTAVLRSWTLIPQKSGKLVIDPAELVCQINVRTPRTQVGSIFDSFFQDDYHTVRKRVSSPAVTIAVSALPSGAPDSFGGGVGNFKMSVSLSKDSLKTHDAASLKVVISGKGNLALLEAPKPAFPHDFETYDVKITDGASSRTFEFPFIPRSSGDFVLPALQYTYYDVSSRTYVTLSGPEIAVYVERSENDALQPVQGVPSVQAPARKDVKDLANDIRFIHTSDPHFSRQGHLFAGSLLFWLIFALLLILAICIWFIVRAVLRSRSDVVSRRNRAAARMATKRLSTARQFLDKGLVTAFYEELHRALLGFVSDKFNIDAADMSHDGISARFVDAGLDQKCTSSFLELLDACEFARYAPSSDNSSMAQHYHSAMDIITLIDNNMHRKTLNRTLVVTALLAAMSASILPPVEARADDRADSLWNAGLSAYSEGRWEEALQDWKAVEALGMESPHLYYNIGNAFFKLSDLSHSILYYEKALKLDPSDRDARYNLEYASSMTRDRIESVPEFILAQWWKHFCYLMSSGTWAVFTLVLLALMLACLLLILLSRSCGLRRLSLASGAVSLVLMILCLSCSLYQRSRLESLDRAVVTATVAPVKSSPAIASSTDLFVLHEGTRVDVVESAGLWYSIKLSDGRRGWLEKSNLELF